MAENGSGNGTALWKVLGPILLPAVVTLTVAWFAFQGDSVTMAEHLRLMGEIKQMETIQRTELTTISVKVAVLQSQLDAFRRNLTESRYPPQKGPRVAPYGAIPEEME